MTTKIIKNEYVGGKRIETIETVYTLAEDTAKLGQLYFAKGTKMALIDNPPPKSNIEAMKKDLACVETEIREQMARISNYETADSSK